MLTALTFVGLLIAGILGEGETTYPRWVCLSPEPIISAIDKVNESGSYSSPAATLAYNEMMAHPDCTPLPGPLPFVVTKRVRAYVDFDGDAVVIVELESPTGVKAYSWMIDEGSTAAS